MEPEVLDNSSWARGLPWSVFGIPSDTQILRYSHYDVLLIEVSSLKSLNMKLRNFKTNATSEQQSGCLLSN